MIYLEKQEKECTRIADIGDIISAQLEEIVRDAKDAYMKGIVSYMVNYRSPAHRIALLPEQYILLLMTSGLEKLPYTTWKVLEKKFNPDNFNDVNDLMDAMSDYLGDTGSWLVYVFGSLPQKTKLFLLNKLTFRELNQLLQTVQVCKQDIVGSNNSYEEMPIGILLMSHEAGIKSLESESVDHFFTDVMPRWDTRRIALFLGYIASYNGFRYQGDHGYVQQMIETVLQKLPLTKVTAIIAKEKGLEHYLTKQQRFDIRAASSDTVLNMKYEITELGRSPDTAALSNKESFELLATLVNG